jgi:hypothetical protein
VDFFGTGPRIPMIAVSPFSTGGHIRANPVQDDDNVYVPRNMPAIGDCLTCSTSITAIATVTGTAKDHPGALRV